MLKKELKWLICLITFFLFIIISYLVIKDKTFSFDTTIYNFFAKHQNPNLTKIVILITNLASELTLIILTLLIFIIIKNKKIGFISLINLIIILLLNQGLKLLFVRERPTDMIINMSGYSYPSGHSMISFAFYGFLIYLLHKTELSKITKYLISTFLIILIIAIGLSRIYLHVHYASDVLSGFCLSASYLIIFIYYAEKYLKGEKLNERKKI